MTAENIRNEAHRIDLKDGELFKDKLQVFNLDTRFKSLYRWIEIFNFSSYTKITVCHGRAELGVVHANVWLIKSLGNPSDAMSNMDDKMNKNIASFCTTALD